LISLLYQNSPTELRLILIDPKRVEFTSYNEVPPLLAPVIVEPNKAVNAPKGLIGEMERLYRLFSDFKVRDLESFNKAKGKEMSSLPQIVLVIDELADLMAVSSKEVESYVARLAQMARATGIHLIIATQRPSVDVVTGLIKANFPTRIAFAVTSGTDSRTILDSVGAEKLLGHGDMLYLPRDASKPKRIQGVLVDDREVKSVTKFLKDNRTPSYIDEVTADKKNMGSSQAGGGPDEEPLMEEATEEVVRTGKASTSYLQRKFRIGYARAARLMDLLEEQGVIGAGQGAKPREVLIDREEWLQNQGQAGLNQYTDEETGETYKSGKDY
jgi:S-DNA-T family DNA segregation ATPase FtsK/SpoIIIE